MDKKIIFGTILALIAGLFVSGQQILQSPDYEAIGTCSADEIDKTYAALETQNLFKNATQSRVMYDFWHHHRFEDIKEPPKRRLDIKVKKAAYGIFSRHQTAAFACNHVSDLFATAPKTLTMPDMVRVLAPYQTKEEDIWATAACFSTLEVYSASPPTVENVRRYRELCKDRTQKRNQQARSG